jgi:hypothetical protein
LYNLKVRRPIQTRISRIHHKSVGSSFADKTISRDGTGDKVVYVYGSLGYWYSLPMSEIYGDYKTYWGINDLTDKTN